MIEFLSDGLQLATLKVGGLDRPPGFGGYRKVPGSIPAPNDFDGPGARPAGSLPHPRRLVSDLGENDFDKKKAPPHPFGEDLGRAIPVLHTRWMNGDGWQ